MRPSLALGKTEIVFGPCLANALFKWDALERASQFRRQPTRYRRQGLPGRSLVESARRRSDDEAAMLYDELLPDAVEGS